MRARSSARSATCAIAFSPAAASPNRTHGNRELLRFLDEIALQRLHPRDQTRTVRDSLADEREYLLALPDPARP
jgi:hypothetical protein